MVLGITTCGGWLRKGSKSKRFIKSPIAGALEGMQESAGWSWFSALSRSGRRATMGERFHQVFITGGTGYMGRRLIVDLLARRHLVRALVRPGSEGKLPPGCPAVLGDALNAASYAQ